KPVIDIVGSVSSLEDLDKQKINLELIGYEYKGEFGIKGRRYCVLYNPEKTIAFVHLHIFQQNNTEIEKHLLFRDYLLSTPEAKQAYSQYKRFLIENQKISREDYSDAKNEIIAKIQLEANSKQYAR
ncbi:MAG TPA: GrpB family protein, partial [Pseudobdellovibrionaceae bacterium]|nr:GrpB family protein [Pseudobdellovibrionaceae bacterium]